MKGGSCAEQSGRCHFETRPGPAAAAGAAAGHYPCSDECALTFPVVHGGGGPGSPRRLTTTTAAAAPAPASLNGAFHHTEERRNRRATQKPRRAAIGLGPRHVSRSTNEETGPAATPREARGACIVPVTRGGLRGGHLGTWQPPFCVLAAGPVRRDPGLLVAKHPNLYPYTHTPLRPGEVTTAENTPLFAQGLKSALGQS